MKLSKGVGYMYTIQKSLNHCIDIYGHYSMFHHYQPLMDTYRYGSSQRKYIKAKYGLYGKVEDHHLIPKQFKYHPVIIESGFQIHCSHNLKMMPSNKYNVPDHILIHHTHPAYNQYVKQYLDGLMRYDTDAQQYRLLSFTKGLDIRLNYKNMIPWTNKMVDK